MAILELVKASIQPHSIKDAYMNMNIFFWPSSNFQKWHINHFVVVARDTFNVLIYRGWVCFYTWRKNVMINEIIGFGGFKFFGVVMLIKLTRKCIIRLDRFLKILKDLDWNDKKWPLFSMFKKTGFFVSSKVFFQANGIIGFDGLNFFS